MALQLQARKSWLLSGIIAITFLLGAWLFASIPITKAEGGNQFPNIDNGTLWTLGAQSPNSNSLWLFKDNNVQYGQFKHILKGEPTSNIRKTKLRAYYNAPPQFMILNINRAFCQFDNASGNSTVDVYIGDYDNAANNAHHIYGRNTVNACENNNANGFGRSGIFYDGPSGLYQIPTPPSFCMPIYGNNPNRGCYIDITTTLSGDSITNAQANAGKLQQVRFKITVTNSQGIGFQATGAGDSASNREFGVVAGGLSDDNEYGIKVAIPFGLACGEDNRVGGLSVYDVDNPTFQNVYIKVYRRDPDSPGSSIRPLNYSEYDVPPAAIDHVNWQETQKRWETTTINDNDDSKVKVKMEKGIQYMLVVINPKSGGQAANPTANVLSLFLPTDSRNGTVNCKYRLTPHLNSIPGTYTYNPDFQLDASISNDAPGAEMNGDRDWQVTKARFASNPTRRTGIAIANQNPCEWMGFGNGPALDCQPLTAGLSYPNQSTWSGNYNTGTYPVGTWLCFMTSIRQPSWDSGASQWAHSDMQCSVSGISPKIQAHGHDIKADGRIHTSTGNVSGRTYGSWGEYGVFSDGVNNAMASGSGLLGGVLPNTQRSLTSELTFAFPPPSSIDYGRFGGVTMPTVSQNDAIVINGPLTIDSGALDQQLYGPGTKLAYRVKGTLTINDNLRYSGTFNDIKDIPRVKFIADDIVIGPNVTHIDPWLTAVGTSWNGGPIANGRISTCSQVNNGGYFLGMGSVATTSILRANICNLPLTFNGPVVADQIFLYRTFDSPTGGPAETFNLRADNFLSSYVGGGTVNPVATTDTVTELPPRF